MPTTLLEAALTHVVPEQVVSRDQRRAPPARERRAGLCQPRVPPTRRTCDRLQGHADGVEGGVQEGEVPGHMAPRPVPRRCAEPAPRGRLGERSDEAGTLENALDVPPLRHHRRAGPQRERREAGGGAGDCAEGGRPMTPPDYAHFISWNLEVTGKGKRPTSNPAHGRAGGR